MKNIDGQTFFVNEKGEVLGSVEALVAAIERIEDDTTAIQTVLKDWGVDDGTGKLDDLVAELQAIINQGNEPITVKEGQSVTKGAGYYGEFTVTGIAGGGDYELTEGSATPSKSAQTVTPVQPIKDDLDDLSGKDQRFCSLL